MPGEPERFCTRGECSSKCFRIKQIPATTAKSLLAAVSCPDGAESWGSGDSQGLPEPCPVPKGMLGLEAMEQPTAGPCSDSHGS